VEAGDVAAEAFALRDAPRCFVGDGLAFRIDDP
jgi:hypothetical protein